MRKHRSSAERLQNKSRNRHQESIEVDVVGVKDVSCLEPEDRAADSKDPPRESLEQPCDQQDGRPGIFDMFPEESEKEQFFQFLEVVVISPRDSRPTRTTRTA